MMPSEIPFPTGYEPLDEGNKLFEQDKYKEAIVHYTKAIVSAQKFSSTYT